MTNLRTAIHSALATALVAALLAAAPASAQPATDYGTAPDADLFWDFGAAVDVQGDTLVVGAIGADGSSVDTGAVYEAVLTAGGTWDVVSKLSGSGLHAGGEFGGAVAIDGDVLAVGAPMEGETFEDYRGAGFIFERDPSAPSGWTQVLRVDGDPSLFFYGEDVDVSAETVIFTAGYELFPGGDDQGGAEVYRRSAEGAWELEAFLTAPDAGGQAAVQGDLAVVATVTPEGGEDRVHLFERQLDGSWPLEQTLIASNDEPGSDFGDALALDGDRMAVAASDENPRGAVYVFERQDDGQWLETARIVPPESSRAVRFGYELDLAGDLLVVGDPFEESFGEESGRAWLFRLEDGEWRPVVSFRRGDRKLETWFGGAVAVDPGRVVIGARDDDLGARGSGAVFITFVE